MASIFLINPLVIDDQREIPFLEQWIKQANFARTQSGLVSMSLHRSIDDASHFRFVVLEEWDSIGAWEASKQFNDQSGPRQDFRCPQYPGLYRVFSR
jgi:heme-degrading monooxygenase HmoA